jgi:ferrochelatase
MHCLETLEEIEEQNKITFLEAGGKAYHYIPCLNDRPDHIAMLANLIQQRARAWQ